MAPAAHRYFKKFDMRLQEKVKTEAMKLAEEPYRCERLKGPLKALYSYKFSFKGTTYRMAYRVIEDEALVEIVLVRPRENFYELLERIIRK
ncbi:type II toxin-antitoxin system RelE/ParE family toxin [Candidatus Bipolaricaulota bacterium]|nr:type II toxin-antitoxin system RelE/ParE family toxin [Candidatus Bipolaricaulota bacterium]